MQGMRCHLGTRAAGVVAPSTQSSHYGSANQPVSFSQCMLPAVNASHWNAGFVVPSTQFSNYGSANHPGVTQSSWNSCFSCGHALNYCTAVAGSPNTTDQFSLFRGALLPKDGGQRLV